MKRALLFLCVTAAIAAVTSLAYVSVARAEDEGGAVTCYPSADDVLVQSDAVGGWGRVHCTGTAFWALEVCLQKWVRPDDEFYNVTYCGHQSDESTSGEWPDGSPCSRAGYGEFRMWVHVAWYANGWHDAYTTSNVAWACTG